MAKSSSTPTIITKNVGRSSSSLFDEMNDAFQNDKILEARSILDKILTLQNDNEAPRGGGEWEQHQVSKHESVMNEIMTQSDIVRDILHDLDDDTSSWTPTNNTSTTTKDEQIISVHYKNDPTSPFPHIRTSVEFPDDDQKTFLKLCSIFAENDLTPQWFPGHFLKKSDTIHEFHRYSKIVHFMMEFPRWMPLSPRDCVSHARGYHIPKRNAILIVVRSLQHQQQGQRRRQRQRPRPASFDGEEDGEKDVEEQQQKEECEEEEEEEEEYTIPSPKKGVIRIENQSAFYVELKHNTNKETKHSSSIVFKQIIHDDLKLNFIPNWILNYMQRGHVPYEAVRAIRTTLDRYGGSPWERRVLLEKRDFYDDIERVLLSDFYDDHYCHRHQEEEEKKEEEDSEEVNTFEVIETNGCETSPPPQQEREDGMKQEKRRSRPREPSSFLLWHRVIFYSLATLTLCSCVSLCLMHILDMKEGIMFTSSWNNNRAPTSPKFLLFGIVIIITMMISYPSSFETNTSQQGRKREHQHDHGVTAAALSPQETNGISSSHNLEEPLNQRRTITSGTLKRLSPSTSYDLGSRSIVPTHADSSSSTVRTVMTASTTMCTDDSDDSDLSKTTTTFMPQLYNNKKKKRKKQLDDEEDGGVIKTTKKKRNKRVILRKVSPPTMFQKILRRKKKKTSVKVV